MVARALAILLGTTGIVVTGCLLSRPPDAATNVQSLGTVRRLEEYSAVGLGLGPKESGVLASPPELRQKVNDLVSQFPDLVAAYSPSGTYALLHPQSCTFDETSVWLLSNSTCQEFHLGSQSGCRLVVLWSPDSRRAAIGLNGDQSRQFTLYCLSVAHKDKARLHVGHGPRGTRHWSLGPFSVDGSVLFVVPAGDHQLWMVSMPDCTFSLLYTLPPVRYTPRRERMVKRHGPPPHGRELLGNLLLPSPSGNFLLFNSYAPDNVMGTGCFFADLRTGEVRLMTWERAERYYHMPVSWAPDERSFVFCALTRSSAEVYFDVELPPDVLEPHLREAGG